MQHAAYSCACTFRQALLACTHLPCAPTISHVCSLCLTHTKLLLCLHAHFHVESVVKAPAEIVCKHVQVRYESARAAVYKSRDRLLAVQLLPHVRPTHWELLRFFLTLSLMTKLFCCCNASICPKVVLQFLLLCLESMHLRVCPRFDTAD